MATASTFSVDGSPASHTLTPRDVDWVKFRAVSGKAYRISITSSSNCSLSVFSSDSTQQAAGDPYNGARWFIAESDGDYYLRISSAIDSVQYSVQVSSLQSDAYDRDDTRATAKELQTTGVIQNRILNGPPDLIKIRVQSGVKYWARIVNSTTNCIEAAFLPDGLSNPVSGGGCLWGAKYLSAVAASDTVVYLKVFDKDPSELTPFSVSVSPESVDSFEPDNSLSSAKPISTDGTIQKRTVTITDADWISFQVDSGVSYRVTATGAWDSEPIDLDVFTTDSASLASQANSSAPTLDVVGRRTTVYYIRVTAPAPTADPSKLGVTVPTSLAYELKVLRL
jgi:hypothetical protein